VAVVQISRIQVRRGQKNQGSGLPQLASGEIAWAIDTREMFIGNGAVAEGAPAVGNTKILTEYDDILNLADTYTYRANDSYVVTGANSSNPVTRTLQERLDDRVSVRSFGATGDGVTDDTVALQRAIDQLYLNTATKGSTQSRVILHLEAGTYVVSDTIYIPPYATLIGAGADKTVIYQTVNKPTFITVSSISTAGSPATEATTGDSATTSLNQAQDIVMQGMTIETTQSGSAGSNNISSRAGDPLSSKGLILQSCKNSSFKDLHFKGTWTIATAGDAGVTDYYKDVAVLMNNLSAAVGSSNNTFEGCVFEGYSCGVRSDWNVDYNNFEDCEFDTLGDAISFGELAVGDLSGNNVGPSYNNIEKSTFNDILRYGLWIKNGLHNNSSHNSYTLVGVDGGVETDPVYPVIKYEDNTNKSAHDYFARTAALSYGAGLDSIPYVPEIDGTAMYSLEHENVATINQTPGVRLFRLPGVINQSYEVNYIMVSENYYLIRSGTLHVVVDGYQEEVEISDEYHFAGDESYVDSISFGAILRNADGDADNETIDINVISTMPVDDQTKFKFTINAKKTDII